MKIHYFQRYHAKENVATANTMLLLSRFYAYSSDKFFRFLKAEWFFDEFEPEISFDLQVKNGKSVPDAVISQDSFKIVVETKMSDWFYSDQIIRHIQSFDGEKQKIILTLAPEKMSEAKKKQLDEQIRSHDPSIIHINTTFDDLVIAIQQVLNDDRDYEMQAILDDYMDYCCEDGLIQVSDSWKYMRMQLAGTTFDYNIAHNIYYVGADCHFRPHDYLGLYRKKSIRAVGKVVAVITARATEDGLEFHAEKGELTETRKRQIDDAMKYAQEQFRYSMDKSHRYYFVEQFYQTDFRKATPKAPMGGRVFDLTQILENDSIPAAAKLAELLRTKTWG